MDDHRSTCNEDLGLIIRWKGGFSSWLPSHFETLNCGAFRWWAWNTLPTWGLGFCMCLDCTKLPSSRGVRGRSPIPAGTKPARRCLSSVIWRKPASLCHSRLVVGGLTEWTKTSREINIYFFGRNVRDRLEEGNKVFPSDPLPWSFENCFASRLIHHPAKVYLYFVDTCNSQTAF